MVNPWHIYLSYKYKSRQSEDTNGRGTQTKTVFLSRQTKPYHTGHRQYVQQNQETGNGSQQRRKRRSGIMAQKKYRLGLIRRMLMIGLEGMRVHNNNPVHHMRVVEQCDSSPIHQEQQGKKELHDATQLLQKNNVFKFEDAKVRVFMLASKLQEWRCVKKHTFFF